MVFGLLGSDASDEAPEVPGLGPAFPVVIPVGKPGGSSSGGAAAAASQGAAADGGGGGGSDGAEAAMWKALASVINTRLTAKPSPNAAFVAAPSPRAGRSRVVASGLPTVGPGYGMGALPRTGMGAGLGLPLAGSGSQAWYVSAAQGGDLGRPPAFQGGYSGGFRPVLGGFRPSLTGSSVSEAMIVAARAPMSPTELASDFPPTDRSPSPSRQACCFSGAATAAPASSCFSRPVSRPSAAGRARRCELSAFL